MLVLMIIFLVLQIWVFNNNCCKVTATTTTPENKDSDDEMKRSELYRRFFNGRFKVNIPKDKKSFEDVKRRVPSCPDPLHN